jgi:ABC-2 type transport system ATP-binding protein
MTRRGRADVAAIEAVNLRRTYRTSTGALRRRSMDVDAVRGVTFTVAKGELYGLLGPNGAGKTTTIKMLITLLVPTSGVARVLGHDVVTDAPRVRASIGYVFGGDRGLYERLSALDNLRYFAELYGVEPRTQRQRIPAVLDLVGLAGRERERVEGYSRGMRQRLHMARGLLHDPPVVFLDEPTIGVDPVGARELRTTIASLTEAGKTVLLTTHYMFEADALCDRIGVIAGGELLSDGTPADLKARVADRTVVEIEAYGVTADVVEELRRIPRVAAVSVVERDHAQVLQIQSATGSELTQTLLARLDGTRVGRVTTREPTLEDAYIDLVTEGKAR